MDYEQIAQLEERRLVPTYKRLPFLAVRGDGCYLYDDQGREYLDFLGGLGVNALGHNHPEMMAVLRDPSETLLHVSNLIYHRFQAPLADRLTRLAGLDRAFFANTGTEAVEGAIKLARAFGRERSPERTGILAVENSFHGRTLGALAATWPEKYRKPFEPLPPGVQFVRQNDISHLQSVFTPNVAALLVEVIQGEGGVVELDEDFLRVGQDLCHKYGALFICDEIQCGLGRTGNYFAFQGLGLKPDIVLVAKPLAGGLPLAAILVREDVAQAFHPGMHGTTFGGGPLQCRMALKFVEILERPGFIDHVREVGSYFKKQLLDLQVELPVIRQVRGQGLMLAAELTMPGKEIVQQGVEAGFLFNCTQENVLRFLPPLIIERRHVDQLIEALRSILVSASSIENKGVRA
ncbi:MAG TPA: aspartate aminotransferase family protein [Terriglobia bacterium]|jgi:predicted acetylornithine/succinylornithine family transaminase|nr:aspartate aminotransferase family protein [Terriglobia bacterium]